MCRIALLCFSWVFWGEIFRFENFGKFATVELHNLRREYTIKYPRIDFADISNDPIVGNIDVYFGNI